MQMQGDYQDDYCSPRRGKKRKVGSSVAPLGKEELSPRSQAVASQQRSSLASVPARYSGEGLSPSKRRRVSTRGQSADLAFCEYVSPQCHIPWEMFMENGGGNMWIGPTTHRWELIGEGTKIYMFLWVFVILSRHYHRKNL